MSKSSKPGAKEASTLKKTIVDCAPFKDSASTLVCVGCLSMLMFPSGAKKVRCGECRTVTAGIKVRCTACREAISVELGLTSIRCPACLYEFSPQAKLKIRVPETNVVGKELPRIIKVRVSVDRTVSAKLRADVLELMTTQPLRESAMMWATSMGADFSRSGFYSDGRSLDASQTPRQLDLKEGCEIEVRQNNAKNIQGHDFATSQFAGPTNCAGCKEFIWGIYHQGKRCTKCKIPVHHRCADKLSSTCETDLRNMFGIVNINDEDDEGDSDAVIGVVVPQDQKMSMAAHLEEVTAPECDPSFMQGFARLTNFTDEEIQEMWLKYDADQSGELEHDEIRQMLTDLLAQGGAQNADLTDMRAPVERLIYRMDTSGDGIIQWDEFWNFFKAQQDANALKKFDDFADLSLENLYELWGNYDTDGSGVLEIDEIMRLLNDLLEQVHGASSDKESVRVLDSQARGKFESFLCGAEAMTWETFYTVFVPLLQTSKQLKEASKS